MTPRTLINDYERTPRAPIINNPKPTKLRTPRVQVRFNQSLYILFMFYEID